MDSSRTDHLVTLINLNLCSTSFSFNTLHSHRPPCFYWKPSVHRLFSKRHQVEIPRETPKTRLTPSYCRHKCWTFPRPRSVPRVFHMTYSLLVQSPSSPSLLRVSLYGSDLSSHSVRATWPCERRMLQRWTNLKGTNTWCKNSFEDKVLLKFDQNTGKMWMWDRVVNKKRSTHGEWRNSSERTQTEVLATETQETHKRNDTQN